MCHSFSSVFFKSMDGPVFLHYREFYLFHLSVLHVAEEEASHPSNISFSPLFSGQSYLIIKSEDFFIKLNCRCTGRLCVFVIIC